MHIEKGNIVNYENEPHMIVHVYTSDYVEIRKVGGKVYFACDFGAQVESDRTTRIISTNL